MKAIVPLRWLRPGVYRWADGVSLVGDASSRRHMVTVFQEPAGSTCVIVRRRPLIGWLLRKFAR